MTVRTLDQVKLRMAETHLNLGKRSGKMVFFGDLEWLIEQAERVEELENQVARHKEEKYKCFKKAEEMRKALKFYADGHVYEPVRSYGPFGYDTYEILKDAGFRASKALEGSE